MTDANQPADELDKVSGSVQSAVSAALSEFGAAVEPRLRGPGEPEDQMRGPLETLFQRVAVALQLGLVPHGESALPDLHSRPDYAIEIDGAIVGYVEVKAPGKGADPFAWSEGSRDRAQWDKIKVLPNVLYTDGNEWSLYRSGERRGDIARVSGHVRSSGGKLTPLDGELARVLAAFLQWEPTAPRTIGQLVQSIAGLCRLLRDEVLATLVRERKATKRAARPFTNLANDWRELLFPDASDFEFADGYAQTVSFGLLLARVEGISFDGRPIREIAAQLGKAHSLMGRALEVLTDYVLGPMALSVDTLLRVVGVVDWTRFERGKRDLYLYLYEHFLAQYDPALRQQTGSYYTPVPVVEAMVRFTDELLRSELAQPLGFASEHVVVVDPAMGTGAYLLNIIESAAQVIADEEGDGAVAARMRQMAERIVGFEQQTGPFAVAELRTYESFRRHKADIPTDGIRLYVADTLDNPWAEEAHIFASLEPIARSRRAANRVKRDEPVVVVIGNPPYKDREMGGGGWVESGDGTSSPLLDDFRAEGKGKFEYVLRNLAIYFWRWSTWKVFDHHADAPSGVVSLITPASYLTGPGFAGMREYLRRVADEGWVIDLTPEGHRPPVNTRPFPQVAQPLAIAFFVRRGEPNPNEPAKIHYRQLHGRREEKFDQLASVSPSDADWFDADTAWQAPLIASTSLTWQSYPLLSDLMPWQDRGVKPGRAWVYSPDRPSLLTRWEELVAASAEQRRILMKETGDRHIDRAVEPLPGGHQFVGTLREETDTGTTPTPIRVSFRSFDEQWLIPDRRLIDRPRPEVWSAASPQQIYVTEQHDQPINRGPALTFGANIPDEHHYAGRGGRVLPLYRDPTATAPNVTPGLLQYLADQYGVGITASDFLAYIAAVTAHDGFVQTYLSDLETPGVRVPLTANADLWTRAVAIGRRVIWAHTYGQRYADAYDGRPPGPPRLDSDERPKVIVPIPNNEPGMPERPSYDAATHTLVVGAGRIAPVRPEVWDYEITGMRVIRKWFGYRQKKSAGRKSSPLDDRRPKSWQPGYTSDLLNLIQVLTIVVDLEREQAELLADILQERTISVADLEVSGVFPVPVAAREPGPGEVEDDGDPNRLW